MNLGEKEDEEVTDEVAYDKKKVVKLVDEKWGTSRRLDKSSK